MLSLVGNLAADGTFESRDPINHVWYSSPESKSDLNAVVTQREFVRDGETDWKDFGLHLVCIYERNEVKSQFSDSVGYPLAIPLYCSNVDHSGREGYLLQGLAHELLNQRCFGWEGII